VVHQQGFWRSHASRLAICLTFILTATTAQASQTWRGFAVGNSLTADAWHVGGPARLAATRGDSYTQGLHINGSVGLKDQWDRYLSGIAPYYSEPSPFQVALVDEPWDAIVLQPFKNTAAQEISAARNILDLASANTLNTQSLIYVYAPATQLDSQMRTQFSTRWIEPYAGEAVGNSTNRAFFQTVFDGVRSAYPQRTVGVIPAGDVWAAFGAKIDAGQVPGLTSSAELYRDELHASALGQLTTVATWYAVTLRQDPRGLPLISGFGSTTQAQADAIFQVAWDVVTADSARTLVLTPGDTNADHTVDFDDLLTLAQNYRRADGVTWFSGDFDADARVDFNDLVLLAQHYRSFNVTADFSSDWAMAQSLVPEPGTLGVALLATSVLAIRRRA
jgi:hypothetical protein